MKLSAYKTTAGYLILEVEALLVLSVSFYHRNDGTRYTDVRTVFL